MSDREMLLKAMNLVKPALASQSYIPALTHVAFDGESAMSYNDITAISVRCPQDFELCLPGELLIKCLNNLSTKEVELQQPSSGAVVIAAGRSKLKLASLALTDFPFDFPSDKATQMKMPKQLLEGIERCLISVGADPSHPAQMGVTMEEGKTGGLLYSTDNFTFSRFKTKVDLKLPASIPLILPTFFCNQLLSLAKAFPESEVTLAIRTGSITAQIGEFATLFSKMVVDLEPIDFARVLSKHISDDEIDDGSETIPDGFESALERAILILGDAQDKNTKISLADKSMKLLSVSPIGEAADSLSFQFAAWPVDPFYVDPVLVKRASGACTKITFKRNVTALSNSDGTFLHMIANSASN